jgi:hypothetical protein
MNNLKIPKLDVKKADFSSSFARLIEIIKFKHKSIDEVAADSKYYFPALIFLLAGCIAGPLGGVLFGVRALNVVVRTNISYFLTTALISIIIALASIYIISFVAVKFFKGQGKLSELFSVIGLCMGVRVLDLVGYLFHGLGGLISAVVGIWLLIILFISIKRIFKMDEANTVLTIIVSIVAIVVLSGLLNSVIGSPFSLGSLDLGSISLTY